jgi:ClpX C4-type zinc finger
MYVRWQPRTKAERYRPKGRPGTDTHWSAILVESKRIDGKPTQQHIAYLGSYSENHLHKNPVQCGGRFWDGIDDKLVDLLAQEKIKAGDRALIEAALSAKVPRPSDEAYKQEARRFAEDIGWDYLSAKQQAALKDEAEQYQGKQGSAVAEIRNALDRAKGTGPPKITCSFCGKTDDELDHLVHGIDAYICDLCVDAAAALIAKQRIGKPWAPEEDQRLRALALSGASVAEMAKQMKRSEEAVRSRAYRLKIVLAK